MAQAKKAEPAKAVPEAPVDPAKAALEAMSNTDRAAVIMLLLGEQQAADVIKFLSPREVQALGASMVAVADLSQETVNAVLDDFVVTLKRQTNLGLGTADYVENVFKRALGADKAATVLSRIMPGSSNKRLEILRWMDARSIAEMILNEHPQVIAIILSMLDYDVAAEVLSLLTPDVRPEVIQRIAMLETVQPTAMEELETIMQQQFFNSSSAKSSTIGGVKTAAKIINFTKSELEGKIMESINAIDADLATRIQDNMITFENLGTLDNKSVQALMRAIDNEMLMTALKGADETVKERFMSNMSQRAREMFLDEMEMKGPIRLSDVNEAQKAIMRIARGLSDKGEIVLTGKGDDFV